MFKKIMIFTLVIMAVLASLVPMAMADSGTYRRYQTPVTMYVYTLNGGSLNVRSTPKIVDRNIIGKLDFGAVVTVTGIDLSDPEWVSVKYSRGTDGTAWVMTRYLTDTKPGKNAKAKSDADRQMATYKTVADSFVISARPTQDEGWVNFRSAPSVHADRIGILKLGKILTVIGETADWYQAVDSTTGRIGYVNKAYVNRV